MTTALAQMGDFSLDFLDGGSGDGAARLPFLRYKQGAYYCSPLTGDQERDLTGSLFAAAVPTYRQTATRWSDDSVAPVEEHAAYLGFRQRLPELQDYPPRANGQDAWQHGFQIDGMLFVSGEWHQATLSTGTVTSNIQLRAAMQALRQTTGRTYPLTDWSPVWELAQPETIKTKAGTNLKVPSFLLQGLVNAKGEVAADLPGVALGETVASLVGRVPCDPATSAPFPVPEAAAAPRAMGRNTEAMLASGVSVPTKPATAPLPGELNDEIPF